MPLPQTAQFCSLQQKTSAVNCVNSINGGFRHSKRTKWVFFKKIWKTKLREIVSGHYLFIFARGWSSGQSPLQTAEMSHTAWYATVTPFKTQSCATELCNENTVRVPQSSLSLGKGLRSHHTMELISHCKVPWKYSESAWIFKKGKKEFQPAHVYSPSPSSTQYFTISFFFLGNSFHRCTALNSRCTILHWSFVSMHVWNFFWSKGRWAKLKQHLVLLWNI